MKVSGSDKHTSLQHFTKGLGSMAVGVEPHMVINNKGSVLALPENIRLAWMPLAKANAQAYTTRPKRVSKPCEQEL